MANEWIQVKKTKQTNKKKKTLIPKSARWQLAGIWYFWGN